MRLIVELDAGASILAAGDALEEVHLRSDAIARDLRDLVVPVGTLRAIREPRPEALASRVLVTAWRSNLREPEAARRRYIQPFEVDEDEPDVVADHLRNSAHVRNVFADPPIAVRTVCMDDPAIGTAADVAALLAVDQLHAAGMTGTGVRIAVVDTGINAAHLASRTTAKLAADGHYTPDGVFVRPGRAPLDHGTMCAFDTQIASTGSTLIDSAALLSTGPGLEAWLDDAIAAYDPLLGGLHDDGWPSLVVTNSWAVIPQAGDLPPQDPGNYSHNDHHLFTEQVRALGAAGADVLFAAGNCGAACDPSRCGYHDEPAIVGANSAEQVLTVGACDVSGTTAGYSSAGPGALFPDKPDVLGYAHFAGSQVFPVDNGTSAACPTIAGVVAAVRARYSPTDISPARLRDLLRASGSNAGVYGSETGYGRLDVASLIARLAAEVPNA